MPALAYSSAIQDQIALRLSSRQYANLSAADKIAIDGTWTSGSPGGHAGEAFTTLKQYANFVQAAGADEAPDTWTSWFIWEVVAKATQHMKPERYADANRSRIDAMRMALTTYARDNSDETTSTEGLVASQVNLRRYVLDCCVRREPMVLPTPAMIDHAIRKCISSVWNLAIWSWRRYQETITIPQSTSTTPTVTYASSITPDGLASERVYYADNQPIMAVNATEMAMLRSQSPTAGKPEYFRITSTASGLVWQFERATDQAYTAYCEMVRALPTLNSASNITTALSLMPADFHDPLRRMVLADVLMDLGVRDAGRLFQAADRDIKELYEKDDTNEADAAIEGGMAKDVANELMSRAWWPTRNIGGGL